MRVARRRDPIAAYVFFAFDPDGIRVEVFAWPSSPYRMD